VDVATFHHLQRLIGKKSPGDKVKMALRRGSEMVECEIELGKPAAVAREEKEAPPKEQADPRKAEEKREKTPAEPRVQEDNGPRPFFGAELEDAGGKGAKVTLVKENSPAAKAGLVAGDIIVQLNDKDVTSLIDACDVIRPLKPGDKLSVKAKHGDKELAAEATLEKK